MRKRLATFGARGRLVRLFADARFSCRRCGAEGTSKTALKAHSMSCDARPREEITAYIVQWGPKASREQRSYSGTAEGKLEAETFFKAFEAEVERLKREQGKHEPLTNRQLWTAYRTAEFDHLRKNTKRLYSDAWNRWEQYNGADTIAEIVSITTIHAFRKALDDAGLATATVQDCIRNVRIVFNWGERMKLFRDSDGRPKLTEWHLFVHKVAKEKRTKPRKEYSNEEFLAVWRARNPELAGQWRAWVAIGLLGIYGNRANEVLNLRWSWISEELIAFDPSVVKTGEEAVVRLFPLTRGILAVARCWREREGYTGDYVVFPGQSPVQRSADRANPSRLEHYSIQSLTDQIHSAERLAKVEVVRFRATHGFRRGLVGDLAEETGDVQLALQAIGDKDIRMAQRYRNRRPRRIDALVKGRAERLIGELPGVGAGGLSETKSATEVQFSGENDEPAPGAGSLTLPRMET